MDNENLTPEVTEEDLGAFDESWGDGPAAENSDMDLSETEEDTHSEEEPAAEENTEAPAEEAAEEPEQGEETAETVENGSGSTFTVKHMGEEKEVGLEEMLALASKGMDYDGLKADRDRLRADGASKQQREFLDELAKRTGAADFAELETRIRAAWLKSDEEAAGHELSETDAILRVQREHPRAEAPAAETETAPTAAKAEPSTNAHDSMFKDFVGEYPNVDPKTIPQEVWSECAKSGDLVGAYRRFENRQLKEQLATLRKNQENKNRSTGSRKTSGATTPKDAFDEGWDSI